jgi:hypothetical protein
MGLMALIAPDIPGIQRDKLVVSVTFTFDLLLYISLSLSLSLTLKCDDCFLFDFFTIFLRVSILNFRCIKMAIVHDIAEGELFSFSQFYVPFFVFS